MNPLPTQPISSVVNKNPKIIASPLQKSSELRTLGSDLENGSGVDSDIAGKVASVDTDAYNYYGLGMILPSTTHLAEGIAHSGP